MWMHEGASEPLMIKLASNTKDGGGGGPYEHSHWKPMLDHQSPNRKIARFQDLS